jgi:xanthine dehydrogenase YagS FAD-binding subunit
MTELRLEILTPDRLVNLKTIPGLDKIQFDERNGLHLGALAILDDIANNKIVRERYPILLEALSTAATPQLRNRGTIAGNLNQDSRCWYYRGQFHCWLKGGDTCYAREGQNAHHAIFGDGPCYTVHPSDAAPALVSLRAEVSIQGLQGERRLFLENYLQQPHSGSRKLTVLEPVEIITGISIPVPSSNSRGVYIKAMDRKVWSFALASVAVQIDFAKDNVTRAWVVLGGVAPKPWRVPEVEAFLQNKKLEDSILDQSVEIIGAGAQPLQHNRYKIALVGGLLKEALTRLRR